MGVHLPRHAAGVDGADKSPGNGPSLNSGQCPEHQVGPGALELSIQWPLKGGVQAGIF